MFEERSPHEEGFADHFDKFVKPKLIGLEEKRLAALGKFRKRLLVTIFIGVAAALFVGVVYHDLGNTGISAVFQAKDGDGVTSATEFAFFLLFGGTALAIYWTKRARNKYYSRHKQALIPEVLRFVGDFDYSADDGVGVRVLEESHLFGHWDRYAGEDLIRGSYHGHRFYFSEVRLTESDNDNRTTEIFRGFVLFLELPWQAQGTTVGVKDKARFFKFFESIGKSFSDLKTVRFADQAFEDHYEVYATHETDARRIVSAQLARAIIELQMRFGPNDVEFSVVRNLLVLTIETPRELMDPGTLEESVLTTENARRFLSDLQVILHTVEAVAESAVSSDRSRS